MTAFEHAKAYLQAGLSLVPVRRDGSKAPAISEWSWLTEELPHPDHIAEWFDSATPLGIGTVCGKVSGNLEIIDFDVDAEALFPEWQALVEMAQPGLFDRLNVVQTPRPGYHVRYRVDGLVSGNQKLARALNPLGPDQVPVILIETRGEGGYALSPGTPRVCHETQRVYQHVGGPLLTNLATLEAREREILLRCARTLDRVQSSSGLKIKAPGPSDGLRPGEDFDRRGPSLVSLLEPHGWVVVRDRGEWQLLRRPGKTSPGWSATAGYCRDGGVPLLRVFSSNAHPFEADHSYGPFRVFALLNHAGDLGAAARALAQQGYGGGVGRRAECNGKAHGHSHDLLDSLDTSPGEWAEPIPIGNIPPPPAFPLHVLPVPVRQLCEEAARALPCPPDYIAVPALVIAGGAIGASRALAIKAGHIQRASLYACVVSPAGSLKSPSLEIAVRPITDAEQELHAVWREHMETYEHEKESYEQKKKAAVKEGSDPPRAPDRPILTRLTVNDVTTEAMASILEENPRGVVMVQDEAMAWIGALNRYREGGKGADRQFWLSCWSGATATIDRRKDHDKGPMRVPNPFVGIIGGLTPSNLKALRGDVGNRQAADDGFLDRILLSYPVPAPASMETWDEISEPARSQYGDVLGRLRLLSMQPITNAAGLIVGWRPFLVKLTPSGKEAWIEFTRTHAAELNAEDFPDHLRGPWSKLRGYCGRLALIVHALRWASGEFGREAMDIGDVDGESVTRGIAAVDYFKSMARRCYSHMSADPRVEPAKKIWEWICRKGSTSFKGWEICRDLHSEKHFPNVDATIEPLRLLESHNLVRERPPVNRPGPGRKPAGEWFVNPLAIGRENLVNRANTPPGAADDVEVF